VIALEQSDRAIDPGGEYRNTCHECFGNDIRGVPGRLRRSRSIIGGKGRERSIRSTKRRYPLGDEPPATTFEVADRGIAQAAAGELS
jgi:hypothetical protein